MKVIKEITAIMNCLECTLFTMTRCSNLLIKLVNSVAFFFIGNSRQYLINYQIDCLGCFCSHSKPDCVECCLCTNTHTHMRSHGRRQEVCNKVGIPCKYLKLRNPINDCIWFLRLQHRRLKFNQAANNHVQHLEQQNAKKIPSTKYCNGNSRYLFNFNKITIYRLYHVLYRKAALVAVV